MKRNETNSSQSTWGTRDLQGYDFWYPHPSNKFHGEMSTLTMMKIRISTIFWHWNLCLEIKMFVESLISTRSWIDVNLYSILFHCGMFNRSIREEDRRNSIEEFKVKWFKIQFVNQLSSMECFHVNSRFLFYECRCEALFELLNAHFMRQSIIFVKSSFRDENMFKLQHWSIFDLVWSRISPFGKSDD